MVIFGALINIIAVLLRIDTSKTVIIIRYQAALGLGGYPKGTVTDLYSFALFAGLIALVAILMSARLYKQKRSLSLLILWLTIVALLFNLIVASSILNF